MEEKLIEIFTTLWSIIPHGTEFWSAIIGAIIGGTIAYIGQIRTMHEARTLRDEDRRRVQQALAYALLFKMFRIQSNSWTIHQYFEGCFNEAARKRGDKGEPWQFIQPLADPPDHVHFSSEEMAMLLALKNNDVFSLVVSKDVAHNSLNDIIKLLNTEHRALTEQLKPEKAEGHVLSGNFDKDQLLALRPQMITVNRLIEAIQIKAKKNVDESGAAFCRLQEVLREELGLCYKLECTVESKDSNGTSGGVSTPR